QRPVEQAGGKAEDALDGAEQAGMAGGSAKRECVLVVDLAAHDATAPAAALGCRRERRVGPEAEAIGQRLLAERPASQPLDGDAKQNEVDVGIDRRAGLPDALEDEGAERRRVLTVGVERLDRGKVRLVRQALPEG